MSNQNSPEPATSKQMNILIWIVIAACLVGFRMHVSSQEAEAVRTYDKSLCWTDACRTSVSVARLKTLY